MVYKQNSVTANVLQVAAECESMVFSLSSWYEHGSKIFWLQLSENLFNFKNASKTQKQFRFLLVISQNPQNW